MTVVVDVQYAQEELPDAEAEVPSPQEFERWVAAALAGRREAGELTIRVVGVTEGAALNETYRHRSGPTNVLSFPVDDSPELDLPLLGDLVICAPLVMREAHEQHKSAMAHWAHLTVHGSLHLLGYDHEEPREAEIMEGLEAEILATLGYTDPYAGEKEVRTAS
jgi:probable rRNA maturation factor